MLPEKSHGRLSILKIAGAIGLPAMAALYLGYSLSIQGLNQSDQLTDLAYFQEVAQTGEVLKQTVLESLETVKSDILNLSVKAGTKSSSDLLASRKQLLHWAEYTKLAENNFRLESALRSPEWKEGSDHSPGLGIDNENKSIEDAYILSTLGRFQTFLVGEARNKDFIVSVRPDNEKKSDYLSVILLRGRKVFVGLVNPKSVFSSIAKFNAGMGGAIYASLILNESPRKTLLHSKESYNGLISKNDDLINKSKKEGIVSGENQDGLQSTLGLTSFSGFPFDLYIERIHEASGKAEFAWSQLKFGNLIVAAGIWILLATLAGLWIMGPLEKEARMQTLDKNIAQQTETRLFNGARTQAGKVHTVEMGSALSESIEAISQLQSAQSHKEQIEASLRRELASVKESMRQVRVESQILGQFEDEAFKIKDSKAVAAKMTAVTSELCQSPVLFFSYHEGIGACILQYHAGFQQNQIPKAMSFTFTTRLVQEIQSISADGGVAAMQEYPPLAELVLKRTGVSHFDAWALTGFGPLGRQSSRPRVLGVVVILKAGVDSALRADSIRRMMRVSGLIYENTLLST